MGKKSKYSTQTNHSKHVLQAYPYAPNHPTITSTLKINYRCRNDETANKSISKQTDFVIIRESINIKICHSCYYTNSTKNIRAHHNNKEH